MAEVPQGVPREKRKRPKPKKAPSRNAGHRHYTDTEICDALYAHRGLISLAADALGCGVDLIYRRCGNSPMVADSLKDSREMQLDRTEKKLFDLIDEGEGPSVHFYLSTIGKKRGYVQRSEVDDGKGAMFADSPQLAALRKAVSELPQDKLEALLKAIKDLGG